jgi:hypothetical protein
MVNTSRYHFFVTVFTILAIDLFGVYKPAKGEGLLIGVIAGPDCGFRSNSSWQLKKFLLFP